MSKVSEATREYWVKVLLEWAESRLPAPQFDECKQALAQAPATSLTLQPGALLIALERDRQLEEKGHTAEKDDKFIRGELAVAAACYAVEGNEDTVLVIDAFGDAWPWGADDDKRDEHDLLDRLVIAGALIAAEIDRVLRAQKGG